MRFIIKHEIKGRIRVHAVQRKMTMQEADILCYYLEQTPGVTKVKVYEQTGDATVEYQGGREEILDRFRSFSYDVSVPDSVLESSGRALNAEYKEKLIYSVTRRAVMKWLIPCSITNVITTVKSVKYLAAGIRCLAKGKLEVPVLDATAIGVSVLRRDFGTAGSVMFLLGSRRPGAEHVSEYYQGMAEDGRWKRSTGGCRNHPAGRSDCSTYG